MGRTKDFSKQDMLVSFVQPVVDRNESVRHNDT